MRFEKRRQAELPLHGTARGGRVSRSGKLLAVDHPAELEVYPNEYFASNPPYPPFKVVVSRDARPSAAARDEHGHNVLPDLLAHRYFGDFGLTQFAGFCQAAHPGTRFRRTLQGWPTLAAASRRS
jgi:hypothetical protein